MKAIVVTGLLVGFVSVTSYWTLHVRADAFAAAERTAYAAMSLPRFPSACAPAVRLATNDLCAFQN